MNSAVVHAGAVPVLVEMTDDYAIDCDELESGQPDAGNTESLNPGISSDGSCGARSSGKGARLRR